VVQKSAGRWVKLGLDAAGGRNSRGGFGFIGPRLDVSVPLGRIDVLLGSGFGVGGGMLPAGSLETVGVEPCLGTYDGAFAYVDPGIGIQLNTRRVAVGLSGSYWHPIVPEPDVADVPGGGPTGFFGVSLELAFGRFRDYPRPAATPRALPRVVRKKANLVGADMRGWNLAGADLRRARLMGANLEGANLHNANLARANLVGANLAGANLTEAKLRRANLQGANLQGADLRECDLGRSRLDGANLQGAKTKGASFKRASMKGINRGSAGGTI